VTLVEAITVLALIAGPIAAVQVTRYLDDQKEVRQRKLNVFKTLMATRATSLSPAHVEALNRIPLEFGESLKLEKPVIALWRQYLDHLNQRQMPIDQWGPRRIDLLVDLLSTMALAVGYDFDKTEIKNGVYNPQAHGKIEADQEAIRIGFAEVFAGKRPFPIIVTNLPTRAEAPAPEESSTS
jgi:hypothetical protein